MDLWITFLGTAASVPSRARGTSATFVARGGARLLIDCGEGTQRQFLRSGLGLADVDAIFITHLHGDHVLGLPGLVKTYALRGRTKPLHIYGPAGLNRFLGWVEPLMRTNAFRVVAHEVKPGQDAHRLDGARVEAFATEHGVPSVGWALVEDDRPGAFDADAARALGVTPGPDFGVLQRGGTLEVGDRVVSPADVMGPPRRGRRVLFTGDTQPCAQTVLAAEGADVLVHEATFLAADAGRARETRHSTAAEAAEVAARAGVRTLVLTHLSGRYPPRDVKREAQGAFPEVLVPRDFDQLEVPFPERGQAALRRHGDAPPAGAAVAPGGDPERDGEE
ncbi:MAG: ribonuclease Z [Thermoleophilia bacterium]|nr:ribonuclease Z [Thermoleophilia bacterium]